MTDDQRSADERAAEEYSDSNHKDRYNIGWAEAKAGYLAGIAHERERQAGRIAALEVRPGDVLALEYERRLSVEDFERMRSSLRGLLEKRGWENVGAVILDGGARLRVLRNPPLVAGGDAST